MSWAQRGLSGSGVVAGAEPRECAGGYGRVGVGRTQAPTTRGETRPARAVPGGGEATAASAGAGRRQRWPGVSSGTGGRG